MKKWKEANHGRESTTTTTKLTDKDRESTTTKLIDNDRESTLQLQS